MTLISVIKIAHLSHSRSIFKGEGERGGGGRRGREGEGREGEGERGRGGEERERERTYLQCMPPRPAKMAAFSEHKFGQREMTYIPAHIISV